MLISINQITLLLKAFCTLFIDRYRKTRTGRCTLRLSYREPVDPSWTTSNDAGDCTVKVVTFLNSLEKAKSLLPVHLLIIQLNLYDLCFQISVSDGVIATGSYNHVIARNSFKLADFKNVQKVREILKFLHFFFISTFFFLTYIPPIDIIKWLSMYRNPTETITGIRNRARTSR